jgi:hypothetical protein
MAQGARLTAWLIFFFALRRVPCAIFYFLVFNLWCLVFRFEF